MVALALTTILIVSSIEIVRFLFTKERRRARLADFQNKGFMKTLHEIFLEPDEPHSSPNHSDRRHAF